MTSQYRIIALIIPIKLIKTQWSTRSPTPPLRKRKIEDSDAVDFQSKTVGDSCLRFSIFATSQQKRVLKEVKQNHMRL